MSDPTSRRLEDLLALRDRIDAQIAAERHRLHCSPKWAALEAAADLYDVTIDDITGRSRVARIVRARHVACWLMRQHGMTLQEIGAAVGRDHSTAIASVRAVEHQPPLRALAAGLLDERQEAASCPDSPTPNGPRCSSPCDCGHIYGGLTADERHRLTTGARP